MKTKITCDFPGGGIIVRHIDGSRIELSPDLRDTSTKWFYWYFEAEFPAAGEYEFRFDIPAVGTCGPAISIDRGKTWHWGGRRLDEEEGFRYAHDGKVGQVRFCMGIPYLEGNWARLALPVTQLCRSRQGRRVELFKYGHGKRKYFLAARHHCCEMSASYVLEGIIAAALADPTPDFCLFAVPFVDKDGVENGDQGKNRIPHDHARDYGDHPIYPEVQAIMALLQHEQPEIIIDMHSPWLRGGKTNETIYFVGLEPEEAQEQLNRLSAILETESAPDIPFSRTDNIPFGHLWNTRENYFQGQTLCKWACQLPWHPLCASMEIPYANIADLSLTPELWHQFGGALWRALRKYDADSINAKHE